MMERVAGSGRPHSDSGTVQARTDHSVKGISECVNALEKRAKRLLAEGWYAREVK
ncbi:hypothetical protein [Paenibacillus xylaniclasticus]|uniref:hypothetical protein n=1 Tax=Paenibacillus xylaniclasticus TaxID=588083 RepID=UPI0013DED01E|nr:MULTISPECIES: hypothetical protein [Paenibacillus]GFN30348.1 hypothetical protein PCURB6_06080 [Paenibacillus curdlanolyticus]